MYWGICMENSLTCCAWKIQVRPPCVWPVASVGSERHRQQNALATPRSTSYTQLLCQERIPMQQEYRSISERPDVITALLDHENVSLRVRPVDQRAADFNPTSTGPRAAVALPVGRTVGQPVSNVHKRSKELTTPACHICMLTQDTKANLADEYLQDSPCSGWGCFLYQTAHRFHGQSQPVPLEG